jgi:hypothetical protein
MPKIVTINRCFEGYITGGGDMEIGRETPEAAVCARLLEEGSRVVAEGLRRLGLRLAAGLKPAPRKPLASLDD